MKSRLANLRRRITGAPLPPDQWGTITRLSPKDRAIKEARRRAEHDATLREIELEALFEIICNGQPTDGDWTRYYQLRGN
jgi:hypothetical protein